LRTQAPGTLAVAWRLLLGADLCYLAQGEVLIALMRQPAPFRE